MKVISPSDSEVIQAAAKVGLTGGRTYHLSVNTFNVWQFANGSQGSLSKVALYSGPCFVSEIPRLIPGACSSAVVVRQLVALALIGGALFEVDYRRDESGRVSLPSDVQLFNENDKLLKEIEDIRAKLNVLENELKNRK
jgi:hypothetical protein